MASICGREHHSPAHPEKVDPNTAGKVITESTRYFTLTTHVRHLLLPSLWAHTPSRCIWSCPPSREWWKGSFPQVKELGKQKGAGQTSGASTLGWLLWYLDRGYTSVSWLLSLGILAPKQIPYVSADVLKEASGLGSRLPVRSLLGHTWVVNQSQVPRKGIPFFSLRVSGNLHVVRGVWWGARSVATRPVQCWVRSQDPVLVFAFSDYHLS